MPRQDGNAASESGAYTCTGGKFCACCTGASPVVDHGPARALTITSLKVEMDSGANRDDTLAVVTSHVTALKRADLLPSLEATDTGSGPNRDHRWTTSDHAAKKLPVMVLNTYPIYPSVGHFVLRLHRDAQPQSGELVGHIVHVTSGDSCTFASGKELLAWLALRAVDLSNFKENK